MATAIKPMDVDGREEAEEQLYLKGPLSVLTSSVKTNSMVRVNSTQAPPRLCAKHSSMIKLRTFNHIL